MHSTKKSVQIIAEIFKQREIQDVIFSPGSRNAPLVIEFGNDEHFSTQSIADERVAAFFALGIAQNNQHPCVTCCTSGTASLNYAPAIAEAYYQGVPLIIITADRPREWIDHGEGQSIRQNDIYHNYIKGSYDLPQDIQSKQQEWYCNRLVNEAVNLATSGKPGPVHINLPFSEPLYTISDKDNMKERNLQIVSSSSQLNSTDLSLLIDEWNSYDSKLILCGQMAPQNELNQILEELAKRSDIAVISECISNLQSREFNHHIDRSIAEFDDDSILNYKPDLLITIGSAVVSKKIKQLFRVNSPLAHWHISSSGDYQDMFKCLTKVVQAKPSYFFNAIGEQTDSKPINFKGKWQGLGHSTAAKHDDFLNTAPFLI